ncbi:Beclin 1-associated autophagy-related key regulator [Brachionus plicatilis]|uniref:Beclin 1-associated autophagy-related key regulator n=1 Tax=Brachionus plicatilis TaxID=10195 RepID=A0A3M7PYG6_BRAPC|nr:Beclin 1-associated autophagy-related key regulator [Brachionus plicatilis]
MTYQDELNESPPQELSNPKKFNFLISQNAYLVINDKKVHLQRLKELNNNLFTNFKENYRTVFYKNELITSIHEKRKNVKSFKEQLIDQKLNVQKCKYQVNALNEQMSEKKQDISLCSEKIKKCKEIKKKLENMTIEKTKELNELKLLLIEYQKKRIYQLNKEIFDITEIKQKEEDMTQKSTLTALKDALQTVYVNGRWIFANDHVIYRIINSTLPTDGEYISSMKEWLKNEDRHKEYETEDMETRNSYPRLGASSIAINSSTSGPTLDSSNRPTIISGLTHTVQFVNLIAFYFNILLPYNLPHSKFCNQSMTIDQFQNAIAKLNTNIVYMCIHQHVPISNLLPKQTLENLYYFMNYFQNLAIKLREKHPVVFPDHFIFMMNEMFAETDDDNSMEKSIPNMLFPKENEDWETVPQSDEIPSDDSLNSASSKNVSMSLISSVFQIFYKGNTKQN